MATNSTSSSRNTIGGLILFIASYPSHWKRKNCYLAAPCKPSQFPPHAQRDFVRLVLWTPNIVIDMLHFDDRVTRAAAQDGDSRWRVRCFTDDDRLAELAGERVTGYPEFAP